MLVVLNDGWEDELPDEETMTVYDDYRITSRDIYLEKLWRQKHQPDEEDR